MANCENPGTVGRFCSLLRCVFFKQHRSLNNPSRSLDDHDVLKNDLRDEEDWNDFFLRHENDLNPDGAKHRINHSDDYIRRLLILAMSDGCMSFSEYEKICDISKRRVESKESAGSIGKVQGKDAYRKKAELIKDMMAVSCVDGELQETEKECIKSECCKSVEGDTKLNGGTKLFDLALRLLYLRLHFDHLLIVACADCVFQPSEEKLVRELLNSYIPKEWTNEAVGSKDGVDTQIADHFYYKDLSFSGDSELENIARKLVAIVRDDIDRDINHLVEKCKEGKSAVRKWHDEHEKLHKAAVDNLKNKYLLARRFVLEMLNLAYVDNDCSDHEIEIIKEISSEYGISGEEFESLLINVEVKYCSPVSRIHLGFYDAKKSLKSKVPKLIKTFFGGNSRRLVMLAILMVVAIFVYGIFVHKQVSLTWFLYYLNESLSLMFRSHGGLASEIMGPNNSLRTGAFCYLVLQFMAAFSIIVLMFAYFGREVVNDFARRLALLLRDETKVSSAPGSDGPGGKMNWHIMDWIKKHDLKLIVLMGIIGIFCFLVGCFHPCTWKPHDIGCINSFTYIALVVVVILSFIGGIALMLCRWNKGKKIYVIWGYSPQGIALAADLMRMKEHATVIFMLDRDTISSDEYKDATGNLWSYGCHWKKISFTDVGGRNSGFYGFGKFDSVGDCHFILSDNGRANRVLAQRIVDSIKADKDNWLKKRFYPEKTHIYIRVKNSTATDLSGWLDDALIRRNVELKIFNDSEIISENFMKLVDLVYMSPKRLFENDSMKPESAERIKKVLFFGMGANGRMFLKDLIVSGRLAGDNATVTVFESNEDNRHRCVYLVKSVLKQIGKIKDWKECYNLQEGKESDWTWKLPYGDNTELTIEFKNGDCDVRKIQFKEWAWHNIYDDKSKCINFDLIVSCLGDDHVSMSIMRRISRISHRKRVNKNDIGKHYLVQLDDIGYASLYGRYVNKKMISVFGDYRSVFNSRILWSDKISKLAEMFAQCAEDKGVLIDGAGNNDFIWENIKYSSQDKYMRIVLELLELLRIDGVGVEYIGGNPKFIGNIDSSKNRISYYASSLKSLYTYGNATDGGDSQKKLENIIGSMYEKMQIENEVVL